MYKFGIVFVLMAFISDCTGLKGAEPFNISLIGSSKY